MPFNGVLHKIYLHLALKQHKFIQSVRLLRLFIGVFNYIVQFVYDSHFPSKERIQEFLIDHDFSISERTFTRDLERIRYDFGLDILYSKLENGYYIQEEKIVKVFPFFKFLEIAFVAGIFQKV